jgi:hypothetical protein
MQFLIHREAFDLDRIGRGLVGEIKCKFFCFHRSIIDIQFTDKIAFVIQNKKPARDQTDWSVFFEKRFCAFGCKRNRRVFAIWTSL